MDYDVYDLPPQQLANIFRDRFKLKMASVKAHKDEIGEDAQLKNIKRFTAEFLDGQREKNSEGSDYATTFGKAPPKRIPTPAECWQCADDFASTFSLRLQLSIYMSGASHDEIAKKVMGENSKASLITNYLNKPNITKPETLNNLATTLGVNPNWLNNQGNATSARSDRQDVPKWLIPWRRAFQETYLLCRYLWDQYPNARHHLDNPGGHINMLNIFLNDPEASLPTWVPINQENANANNGDDYKMNNNQATYWGRFDWEQEGSYLGWFREAGAHHYIFAHKTNGFNLDNSTMTVIEHIALQIIRKPNLLKLELDSVFPSQQALAKALHNLAELIESFEKTVDSTSTITFDQAFQAFCKLCFSGNSAQECSVNGKEFYIDTSDFGNLVEHIKEIAMKKGAENSDK